MNPRNQAAGRKGGLSLSKNREHMKRIARLGGLAVAKNKAYMANIGRRGGLKVSKDRKHMSEIGKRGNRASRRMRMDIFVPMVKSTEPENGR